MKHKYVNPLSQLTRYGIMDEYGPVTWHLDDTAMEPLYDLMDNITYLMGDL